MANPRVIRTLGALLIVLGLALCGSMVWLIHYLQQAISGANPTRWTGSPEFTRTTFALFYSVFGFGLVAFGSGIFQLSTGRRSRLVGGLTLLAVLPILYQVWLILR